MYNWFSGRPRLTLVPMRVFPPCICRLRHSILSRGNTVFNVVLAVHVFLICSWTRMFLQHSCKSSIGVCLAALFCFAATEITKGAQQDKSSPTSLTALSPPQSYITVCPCDLISSSLVSAFDDANSKRISPTPKNGSYSNEPCPPSASTTYRNEGSVNFLRTNVSCSRG